MDSCALIRSPMIILVHFKKHTNVNVCTILPLARIHLAACLLPVLRTWISKPRLSIFSTPIQSSSFQLTLVACLVSWRANCPWNCSWRLAERPSCYSNPYEILPNYPALPLATWNLDTGPSPTVRFGLDRSCRWIRRSVMMKILSFCFKSDFFKPMKPKPNSKKKRKEK